MEVVVYMSNSDKNSEPNKQVSFRCSSDHKVPQNIITTKDF
jgi:hypothetical protein